VDTATAPALVIPYTLTDCANLILVRDYQYTAAVTGIIGLAAHDLLILQYQFRASHRPSKEMQSILDAIRAAADRQVNVRILLNHPHQTRHRETSHGRLYDELKHPNVIIRHHDSAQVLHAKLLIADERYILLGSHNLSEAALSTSLNASVIIDAPTLALRMLRVYAPIWDRAQNGTP
jgi:phosphatidylserine/phosphatidylglycerophosphate/cardiolipin synthase-like enzyme